MDFPLFFAIAFPYQPKKPSRLNRDGLLDLLNQYLRLRAASAFFLRFTLGFS